MEWLQLQDYMIVALVENTKRHYEQLLPEEKESYQLFQHYIAQDEELKSFLEQFGINPNKPSLLESYEVEQGTAHMFTGKFYFEGYLEMGEIDGWDIVCSDAVLSFTNEEPAPFEEPVTSYVEISFELIKRLAL